MVTAVGYRQRTVSEVVAYANGSNTYKLVVTTAHVRVSKGETVTELRWGMLAGGWERPPLQPTTKATLSAIFGSTARALAVSPEPDRRVCHNFNYYYYY